MLECDVLVVGAGPAGASAAYFCAMDGLNTILLEKNKNIGSHTPLKIDSSPNVEIGKIIKKYNLPVKNHVKLSKWYAPSGNSYILKSKSGEFYFKRGKEEDSYENIVSKRAVENGAKVIVGVDNIKILEKEKIEKVKIRSICGDFTIKPKIIIAADGKNSFFHKFVNKKVVKILIGYGISGYDFVSSDCSNIYLNSKLLPGGYFYVVTCPDGLSSACAVVDQSKIQTNVENHFQNFIKSTKELSYLRDNKKIISDFKGSGYIIKLNNHIYKNVIFVGDAGGFMEPLFGYGMTPAILSSYIAYKSINEFISENDIQTCVFKFNKIITKYLNYEKHFLYRNIFELMENRDLNWIIDFISKIDKKINIGDIIEETFI